MYYVNCGMFMKITSIVAYTSVFFVLLFHITSCSWFNKKYYTDPTLYNQQALNHGPYDVLIVTGYPYDKDSMNFVLKTRVYWAWYLYQKGMAKNIIFSGSAVYTPYIEGKIMALYAMQLGIPSEHIFVEDQAEHSIENLYYSYRIAEEQGFKSIALGTEVAQASFIKSLNDHRFHFKVDFIPIIYDSIYNLQQIKPDFKQEDAYKDDFVSLVERESAWKRIQGTRGRKVKNLLKKEKGGTY